MFPLFDGTWPLPWLLCFAGFVGASVGSFITLITYRLPRGEQITMERSRCPRCRTSLGLRDLVPVFSWLFSRGRCRHCGMKISIRYPLTELACALGAMAIAWQCGATLQAAALMGLWWGIVALVLTDLEHYIILDEVQIALALCGLLYGHAVGGDLSRALLCGTVGALFGLALKYGFLLVRRKDGLGMGDVKFLFVAGIWLEHPIFFVPYLFYAGLLGIVMGLVWRVVVKSERFPFGPALGASLLVCVFYPQAVGYFWGVFSLLH